MRSLLAAVVVIALAFGIYSEVKRAARFREAAAIYLNRERNCLSRRDHLARAGRDAAAGESAREAEVYGTLGRWYSAHVLVGGTPPDDPFLPQGWTVGEAYKRAQVVIHGKVRRFGWTGTDVEFKVLSVFKGKPTDPNVVWVSTRSVPHQAVGLKRGSEALIFFINDVSHGNPACRLFPKKTEYLEALSRKSNRF